MSYEQIQEETVSRYEQILTLNHQAFAAGQYETSYDLLAVALQSAYELNDLERLEFIETLAAAQGQELDADMPEHPLSTSSAEARGPQHASGRWPKALVTGR